MQTEAVSKKQVGRRPRDKSTSRTFTPLALETRTHITTEEAAHHLNLRPQTLRAHACYDDWVIRPARIPGVNALQWPVAAIKAVLGLEVAK